MRRALAIALVGTAALAADPLAQWKVNLLEVQEAVFGLLQDGNLENLPPGRSLQAVPKEARVAVLNAAGLGVKAWTRSEDFKARYRKWRAEQLPQPPRKARKRAELVKDAKAEIALRRTELDVALAQAPKEQAEMVKTTRAQAEAAWKLILADAESPDAELRDKSRYDEEQKSWNELAERFQADPNQRIKVLLATFLEQTEHVDFGAQLNADRTFKNEEWEAKPYIWKAAYRAGPEATRAARAFCLQWLGELK